MIGALAAHIWQSTLFAIAAGLLTVAFRKNRAPVRYWLWFAASLKFFVPFSLLMSAGGSLGWTPSAQQTPPLVTFKMEQITQPFPAHCTSCRPRGALATGFRSRPSACGRAGSRA